MQPTAALSRQRVLVADDDPAIRQLLASAIIEGGHEVVAVEDGREAMRVLHIDSNFGAAIFSVTMPGMGASDLLGYMRTEKRLMRIPVLMITPGLDFGLLTNKLVSGAAAFLPKPFTAGQLQALLQMLLNMSSKLERVAAR
jgi:DNA-binding NtrC family response regulator